MKKKKVKTIIILITEKIIVYIFISSKFHLPNLLKNNFIAHCKHLSLQKVQPYAFRIPFVSVIITTFSFLLPHSQSSKKCDLHKQTYEQIISLHTANFYLIRKSNLYTLKFPLKTWMNTPKWNKSSVSVNILPTFLILLSEFQILWKIT